MIDYDYSFNIILQLLLLEVYFAIRNALKQKCGILKYITENVK